MKMEFYKDPLALMQALLSDDVKVTILCEIEGKRMQAYEFMPALCDISREVVMETLNDLVEMGLIARKIHVRKQPHGIEYALTNEGAMFTRCIRDMNTIGTVILHRYSHQ